MMNTKQGGLEGGFLSRFDACCTPIGLFGCTFNTYIEEVYGFQTSGDTISGYAKFALDSSLNGVGFQLLRAQRSKLSGLRYPIALLATNSQDTFTEPFKHQHPSKKTHSDMTQHAMFTQNTTNTRKDT